MVRIEDAMMESEKGGRVYNDRMSGFWRSTYFGGTCHTADAVPLLSSSPSEWKSRKWL
jgi:hypothetical protein